MIDKGLCDKGSICNPNNYEYDCDKSCDFRKYLGYQNCKCRKKLVDKLVEECTETVEEVNHNESKHKCNSCTLYIVLFSTIFTAIIGIATYFVYSHWCLKKDAPRVVFGTRTQETISLLSL